MEAVTDLPPPPIDATADLRKYPFMPLDVQRVRDSDLACADPEVFRAAVLSWCAAWHQVPAGSLPDDDTLLARLLGFGRDVAAWAAVRAAGGLRGWERHSDGRLYHPVVVEKALEAWAVRLRRLDASKVANQVQKRIRNGVRVGSDSDPDSSVLYSPVLSPKGGEKTPDDSGDTRARVEAGDANDLTTARPGDTPAKPALRIVADLSPDISVLDQLRFAGARIQRDDAGTWLLAVKHHGLERVVQVLQTVVDAGESPWCSTVLAWLKRKGATAHGRPNDGWHYQDNVQFDAEGPHVMLDGERVRYTPTKRLADMKRETR